MVNTQHLKGKMTAEKFHTMIAGVAWVLCASVSYAEGVKQNTMKKEVELTIGKPMVVAQGPNELDRKGGDWGKWQFPMIARLSSGKIMVSFHLGPDAEAEYGKPVGVAYSSNNGATWRLGESKPYADVENGILLPNGDRLKQVQLVSRRGEEFKLPASACDYVCSFGHRRSLYWLKDLPQELGQWRFNRLAAGSNKWVKEDAVVIVPNDLRTVIQEGAQAKPGIGGTPQVKTGVLSFPSFHGQMRVAPDRSLWAVVYCWRLVHQRPQYAPVFLRSTDNGHAWKMLGEIPYQGNAQTDPHANERDGFTEPAFEFMPDGSVICLMRTNDGFGPGPMYLTRSTDTCKTWSTPKVFESCGKYPQLLTLDNGVTLATYGGTFIPFVVRSTIDPSGQDWNAPVNFSASAPPQEGWDTCGHTGLIPLSKNSALIVYSDFNYPDKTGAPRKSIMVRKISTTITP